MKYYVLAFMALLGLLLNMSSAGNSLQPDWSLAILLAILLSKRSTWYWVLPLIGLHDLLLFWSLWVVFPYAAVAVVLLNYADIRLAPGQPQRWLALVLGCMPLLFAGVDGMVWLLTLTLSTWLWSFLSSRREKVYVEPA
jgi:hypothetical protein